MRRGPQRSKPELPCGPAIPLLGVTRPKTRKHAFEQVQGCPCAWQLLVCSGQGVDARVSAGRGVH